MLESVLLCLECKWKVEANTEENRLGDCGIIAITCGTGMVPRTCSKIYLLNDLSHMHGRFLFLFFLTSFLPLLLRS